MATREPPIEVDPVEDDEEGGGSGFDVEKAKRVLAFFIHSLKRHPRVGPVVFLAIALVVLGGVSIWPRTYEVDFRLLAERNLLLPALGNPNRNVPREADAPMRNVQDTILQRDNLVSLIKQVDLIDRWDASRPPLLRTKDKVSAALFGPQSDEDKMHALIGLLEKKLWITPEESSLTFYVDWPSPQIAFEISSLVEKNFLEAKYDTDVSVITEAIRILDDRAKEQAAQVDVALAELTKLEDARKARATEALSLPSSSSGGTAPSGSSGGGTVRTAPRGRAVVASSPNSELASQLEDVRRRIKEIEDERRRMLTDAQRQLAESKVTLGPLHPTVVAETEKVEQLEQPSPELSSLKTQEHALVASLANASSSPPPAPGGDDDRGANGAAPSPPPAPRAGSPVPANLPPAPAPRAGDSTRDALVAALTDREDAATALARTKLQAASAKYNEILGRIEAAHIELDVSKAAFKYKYRVVRPPEFPKKPVKPNAPKLLSIGLIAALLLALLVPGAIDLATGRFYEPWQVQHALNIPVIGELLPPRS